MDTVKLSDYETLKIYLTKFFPNISDEESSYEEAFVSLMKINKEVFCKNLKDIRHQLNISQQEAAKIFGITTSSYCAWEVGRHIPKIEYIKQMARDFCINPIALIYSDTVPLTSEGHSPIVNSSLFSNTNFEEFEKRLNLYLVEGPKMNLSIQTDLIYDFAYYVSGREMIFLGSCIPQHSYLLCISSIMKGKTKEERLELANGHVAIVSYKGGAGYPREIVYSKGKLRLRRWNNITSIFTTASTNGIIPQLKQIDDSIDTEYDINDVDIYALAVDVYFRLVSVL